MRDNERIRARLPDYFDALQMPWPFAAPLLGHFVDDEEQVIGVPGPHARNLFHVARSLAEESAAKDEEIAALRLSLSEASRQRDYLRAMTEVRGGKASGMWKPRALEAEAKWEAHRDAFERDYNRCFTALRKEQADLAAAKEREAVLRKELEALPVVMAGLETPFHQPLSPNDAYQFAWATCVMNLGLRVDVILNGPRIIKALKPHRSKA